MTYLEYLSENNNIEYLIGYCKNAMTYSEYLAERINDTHKYVNNLKSKSRIDKINKIFETI